MAKAPRIAPSCCHRSCWEFCAFTGVWPKPKEWLFPGRGGIKPIDVQVLHAACRSATRAAGLTRHVTVHTLRLANHLLESGVDIRIIQVLLGHNNLSTTARYTQVATSTISRTQSPFDRLTLDVVPPA